METKTYKLIRTVYGGTEAILVDLPVGVKFAELPCENLHKDCDADYVSFIPVEDFDAEKMDKYNNVHYYNFGEYMLITLCSINKNNELPKTTLDELNASVDFSDTFISIFDSNNGDFIYMCKLKGVRTSDYMFGDVIMVNENGGMKIKTNTNISIMAHHMDNYDIHFKTFYTYGEDGLIPWETLIYKAMNQLGVEYGGAHVQPDYDFNWFKKEVESQKDQFDKWQEIIQIIKNDAKSE